MRRLNNIRRSHFAAIVAAALLCLALALPGTAAAAAGSIGAAPSAGTAAAGTTPVFSDISGLWDAAQVTQLAALHIIEGEPGGLFAPLQPVTRAQWAALLQRTFALALPDPTAAVFLDVPAGFWAAPSILAVQRMGWMQGVGNDMFMPAYPTTRAQAVVALTRALGLKPGPLPAFRDAATIPTWAQPSIGAAVSAGLIDGYPDGTFRPDAPLDRAQAAHLLALVYARLHPPAPPPPPSPPAAPQGLYLTSYLNHVDVVWKAVYGASSYTVQRRQGDGPWQDVGSTTDLVWGDYHAQPTVAYDYRVSAVGTNGLTSVPSAPVSEAALTPTETSWVSSFGFSVATATGTAGAVTSGPGTSFGLGGLKIDALPLLPHTETDAPPALLLSDDPETVHTPSVMYEASVSGTVLTYFDHINATGAPARFALLLQNPGPQPLAYTVENGMETTAGGPKSQGEQISAALLGNPQPGASGTLPAGQTISLDPSSPVLGAYGAILGFYELRLDGTGRVAFALAPAGQNPAQLYSQGKLELAATGDGAGRGSFPDATRTIELTPSATQPQAFLLADGRQDPYVTGTDATSGQAVTDQGNFGVVYHIEGSPSVPTALVAVPVGGGYLGALATGGQVVAAPHSVLPTDGSTGFLFAEWSPGGRNQTDWTPPGGSYLPLLLISIPLG